MVRAAAITAVSASISTPVRSTVFTVAAMSTRPPPTRPMSTVTPEIEMGWHSHPRQRWLIQSAMRSWRDASSDFGIGVLSAKSDGNGGIVRHFWKQAQQPVAHVLVDHAPLDHCQKICMPGDREPFREVALEMG